MISCPITIYWVDRPSRDSFYNSDKLSSVISTTILQINRWRDGVGTGTYNPLLLKNMQTYSVKLSWTSEHSALMKKQFYLMFSNLPDVGCFAGFESKYENNVGASVW